jgi:tetratricopeptide (TPR) repeat protein
MATAAFYRDQGKFADAEPLARRAVTILHRALGPDHPTFASAQVDLAAILVGLKKTEEADTLYRQATDTYQKKVAPTHRAARKAYADYAALLRTLKRDEEAAKLEAVARGPK